MINFWKELGHHFETPFTNSVLVFSLLLLIILLVPLIFSRFKIPGIIGLIISGTIIGPHGLNLIEKNSAVDLFSTIGLLYIMFLAGLELDLAEFRKTRSKSFVFGALTFAIPLLIGVPVCYYLLGYALDTSLLIASMFSTHTLIGYPIVNRLGIAKRQPVAVTVGGTILTDTAVLILLAIIAASKRSGLTNEFWASLVIAITAFTVAVAFIIPRVSAIFFRRFEDEKYAHFIYVLLVVFLCAFLAELSGLEPIIGAFAAGLLLNRLIPHSSSLMNRVEFMGNALFIPFFLIAVGMLIDLNVFTRGPEALIVALTLTVVAVASKWFAAYSTGLIFRYSSAERNIVFGLSTAHAAATLAVILVGYNLGLVNDHVLNGTIALILITCVVASVVTERAGKKLALANEPSPVPTEHARHILVPISNPQTMERLLDFAVMLKEKTQSADIVGLTVVKDDNQAKTRLMEAKKVLEKAIIHASASEQKVDIIATIDRNVVVGILRIARERSITDIVMGWSPDHSIADIIFGKTFDNLVKRSSENVFITRFATPLNVHNRMNIICAPFAEKEPGFNKWVLSLVDVARHLGLPIRLHGNEQLHHAFKKLAGELIPTPVQYNLLFDLTNVDWSGIIGNLDLVFVISSREGGISHTAALNVLPNKLVRMFPTSNLVFVYPQVYEQNPISIYEEEVTGNFIDKSVAYISKVLKKSN